MQQEYTAVPVRAGEARRESSKEEKEAKGIVSWLMIGLVVGSVGIYMYDRYEAKAHVGRRLRNILVPGQHRGPPAARKLFIAYEQRVDR